MGTVARRAVIVVVAVVAAAYMLCTAIWISPPNTVRDAMFSTLQPIYYPHVAQGWGLFAKGMVNSDKTILMRAQIQGPDGPKVTGWVDLGELEWSVVLHSPDASRDARTVYKLAGKIQGAYPDVPRSIRGAIEGNALGSAGLDLNAVARRRGITLSSSEKRAVADWTRLEVATRGLATLYAYHFWDRPVLKVQWQTIITPVVRFQHRNSTEPPPAPSVYTVGWRAAETFPPQVLAAWR